CPVLLAMPPVTVRSQSSSEGLIHLRICEGFGLAVVPAETSERRQVRGEALLQVYPEPVFASDVPGMVGDFRNRREASFKLGDRLTIDPHVGVVGKGQETHLPCFLGDQAAT